MAARTACVSSSRVAKALGSMGSWKMTCAIAGMDAQAALAQHGFRSINRNRDAGRAGGFGEKERAFLEGQHAAVGRARAFDKCGDVRAFGEHALRFGNAALRVAGLPLRSTAMNSPWRKPVPRMGRFMSDRFMKAEVRPGMSEMSAGGSRLETWFDMKMQARSGGMRSRPTGADTHAG